MKKILAYSVIALVTLTATPGAAYAQSQGSSSRALMEYQVTEKGDTVFFDLLKEAKIYGRLPKQKGKDWRKYYRLVYNFNKVYPYALVGRGMMAQVDSTIAADELKRAKRDKYVREVELELFRLFEKNLRNMTVTQGGILMRLVDRECGMSPYMIIKEYLNGMAAGFWQGVAKLFGEDLKKRYDPASGGQDAQIEELVQIWDAGDWEAFYFSLFWEAPPKTVLPERLSSQSPKGSQSPKNKKK